MKDTLTSIHIFIILLAGSISYLVSNGLNLDIDDSSILISSLYIIGFILAKLISKIFAINFDVTGITWACIAIAILCNSIIEFVPMDLHISLIYTCSVYIILFIISSYLNMKKTSKKD